MNGNLKGVIGTVIGAVIVSLLGGLVRMYLDVHDLQRDVRILQQWHSQQGWELGLGAFALDEKEAKKKGVTKP